MSFLENVLTGLDTIRDATRDGVARATSLYKTYSPHLAAAYAELRKMSEPDAQKAVLERLRTFTAEARSTASTALGGVLAGASSFAAGMPSQLSFKVFELTGIQTLADAKGALELPELAACHAKIEALGQAYQANRSIDLEPGIAEVDALLKKAGAAIDAFDASEETVRRRFDLAQLSLQDVTRSAQARTALVSTLQDTIASPVVPDSAVDENVAAFTTALTSAQTEIAAGRFASAAIGLSGVPEALEELLSTCQAERDQLTRLTERPISLEARLGAYVEKAQRASVWEGNVDLGTRRDAAKAQLKHRPCNVVEAERLINLFRDAVEEAIAQPKS